MSMTHLQLDMEPLSNPDGHVQDDALKQGSFLKDDQTVVVGCTADATPLIAKGAHIGESIIEDFIAEFRQLDAVEKIYIGEYDADNNVLKELTAH